MTTFSKKKGVIRTRLILCLIVLASLLLSFMGYHSARQWHRETQDLAFAHQAENHFMLVQQAMDEYVLIIRSMKAFFENTPRVTRARFRGYTRPLLDSHPGIQALEWIPRVPSLLRTRYEADARLDGYPGFIFTQRKTQGVMVAAADRVEHFPVYYIEPYAGNEAALGFDLVSEPIRAAALKKARQSRKLVSSEAITLVQEKGHSPGILVLVPVFIQGQDRIDRDSAHPDFAGFVLGVLRIADIIHEALKDQHGTYFEFKLSDTARSGIPRLIYNQVFPSGEEPVGKVDQADGRATRVNRKQGRLKVADREWTMECVGIPPVCQSPFTSRPVFIFAVGLLGTLLLAVLFYLLASDVTRRTQAEALVEKRDDTIRQQLDELASIYRTAPVGLCIVDRDLRFVRINDMMASINGRPVADHVGKTVREVLPKFAATVEPIYHKVLETGQPQLNFAVSSKAAANTKDSHDWLIHYYPHRDRGGTIRGVITVVQDITMLKASELQFKFLFDNLPIGALIGTTAGRLLAVNSALVRAFGYASKEELLEVTATDLYAYPAERGELLRKIRGGGISGHEVQLKTKGGSFFWGQLSVAVFPSESGEDRLLTTIEDISERKSMEQHVRQAQKMEAIGTLAGGIAHDFNNILSAIIGYTDLALYKVKDEDSILKHNLTEIYQAGERAGALVKQILTFARKTEEERQLINIQPIIKESLKFLRSSLPSTIDIRQSTEMDTDAILADPTQLHQIIMNLATNAAHAMRKHGGILNVRLDQIAVGENTDAQEPDLVPGNYVRIVVSDTGHGIPSEVIDKIFDPYFTTKEKGEGTGLGLSVVHGIVKSCNGHIQVDSQPGRGTTFTILLPSAGQSLHPSPEPEEDIALGNETILFVDDEAPISLVAKTLLESLGYTVFALTSSRVALDLFRADPLAYDMVISDMTMPEIRGDRLLRDMMRIRPGLPCILCTGYTSEISEEAALQAGIRAFLYKPFERRRFAEIVRQVLDASKPVDVKPKP